MSERTEIESWVTKEFAELANFGFSQPIISYNSGCTVIDWIGAEIALELELDWREFEAFLLLVRLEAGQLPQGYYVSNGKPCRYHLQTIIKERAWPVDQIKMNIISHRQRHSEKSNVEGLKKRIEAYKNVLVPSLERIIADAEKIFSE